MTRAPLLLGLAFAVTGCDSEFWHRMVTQKKYVPYGANALFDDGRAMRAPPAGTIPRERPAGDRPLTTGRTEAGYVQKVPVPLDEKLLATGRKRFEIVCANCHGLLGDGNSIVAENMALRRPPSLHTLAGKPDGYLFEVITHGYGLMPALGSHLAIRERWAVVAYVRALQRSQRATLDQAPPEVRRRLEEGR